MCFSPFSNSLFLSRIPPPHTALHSLLPLKVPNRPVPKVAVLSGLNAKVAVLMGLNTNITNL